MTHDDNTTNATPNGTNDRARRTSADLGLNSGAYVLNALSPSEAQEFETYLGESETTRNEVTELSDTAVLLGLAVAPVQPSASLKTNLMSQIASMPQLPRDVAPIRTLPQARHDEPVAPDALHDDSSPAQASTPPAQATIPPALSATSAKTQVRWFNRPIIALTSVAAAVALIIGAGAVTSLMGNNAGTEQQQQADALAAITSADDMQRIAAEVSTGGTATLVWSDELASSAMIVDGVPELPEGKTYELWYIDAEGTATPAGLFDVSDSERTLRVLDGKMETGLTVGVTVEPEGGSSAPTTDPIVAIASA